MTLEKPKIPNARLHDGNLPATYSRAGARHQLDVAVGPGDSALNDAFGRVRVAQPFTIFDSKLTNDASPLFWDDVTVSGAGASSTYNTNQASVTLGVSNLTAGARVRQTRRRFNYQPGKSHMVVMTFVMGPNAAGITKRLGYFDAQNGIFLQSVSTGVSLVRRTFTSGVAVDNAVAQSAWNLDTVDGSGRSGITLDFSKTQIMFIDMEWLGVGRVRVGFYVGGVPVYVHEFLHANVLDKVYMSRPNLPIRYELQNDGSGAAASLTCICATVVVEGGQDDTGFVRSYNMANAVMALGTAGVRYPVLGMRLKSGYADVTVGLLGHSILCSTANDKFCWEWVLNGTTTAALPFTDLDNSAVQVAVGTSTVSLSGGSVISSGYGLSDAAVGQDVKSHLALGQSIGGVMDTLYLTAIPFAAQDISAAMQWRELV